MSPKPDLATQFTQLRERVQQAERDRAGAETALQLAQQRLEEVEKQIKALKVNPAKIDETVAALEAQLQQTATEVEAALTQELQQYQQIRQKTMGL